MNRWVFLTALLLWAASLFFGAIWSLRPWFTEVPDGTATVEQAVKYFPIHLASFERSGIRDHSENLASEGNPKSHEFDYFDWASRESISRLVVVLVVWVSLGLIAKWFLGQIMRGKRTWT